MKRITLSIAILGLLAACKKDEISGSFEAAPGVYFIYNTWLPLNIDSISYTFVEKSSSAITDTVWLPVRIAGPTADRARTINMAAVANSTTAVKDKHYKLLNYTMPKDSFATQLGVVLLRDASLQDTSVVLDLRLQPSADFSALMKDTLMADGRFYGRNQVKIIITDRLLKPTNWDSYLVNFFGAYSNVKFRFIAAVLGRSSFPTTGNNPVNFPTMQFYQNTVRNALAEYVANNGLLKDENGNTVVIP
jgi:hypothetical protein